MNITLKKPEAKETSDYYKLYINKVAGDDYLKAMEETMHDTLALLTSLEDAKWDYRYAEGKWSIKEVLLHLIDTERIMTYRALRMARNDKTPLPGFEQDDYIPFVDADQRSPQSILDEYQAVRKATIEMFRYFNDDMLSRLGTASGNPFTPRALGFVIAGHDIHHMSIIRERYLD